MTGMAVAVRIGALSHGLVGRRIGKELADGFDDVWLISANEFEGASLDPLRALGSIAEDKDRLTEGGGLFLNAATIGHDEIGLFHEIVEVDHIKWFNEAHMIIVVENFVG